MWLFDASLAWGTKHGKFPVHHSENALVFTMLRLLETFFKVYDEENVKISKEIIDILNNLCLFSLVWSFGAALEEKCRVNYSEFL